MKTSNQNPLYLQLKSILEEKIEKGEFKLDERIPSETELCNTYKVSRITVRRAVTELVNEGKLEKVQGYGTYVANNPINSGLFKLDGFYKEMEKQGIKVYSKILELKTVLPDLRVANLLSLEPTEAVIRVVRLRRTEKLVVGYQITHLPFKYFPELINENLEDKSLYDTLSQKYKTIPSRAGISLESIVCPPDCREAMQLSENSPVLYLIVLAFDQYNRKIECTDAYFRGDSYAFYTEVNKYQSTEKPMEILKRMG